MLCLLAGAQPGHAQTPAGFVPDDVRSYTVYRAPPGMAIDGLRQHLRRLYRETSSSTDMRGWMGILGCHVFMTGVKETARSAPDELHLLQLTPRRPGAVDDLTSLLDLPGQRSKERHEGFLFRRREIERSEDRIEIGIRIATAIVRVDDLLQSG